MRATLRRLGLAASLLLCGGLYAAFAQDSDKPVNPFAGDPAAVAAGMAVYSATCSACHGSGGAGSSGPALTGALQHGASDAALFQVIQGGIDGSDMPGFAALSDDNIWRIVAYVRSLAAPAPPPPKPVADAGAGERLFFGSGNCTQCHEINGRGLDLASDLSAQGVHPLQAIRDGIAHRMPSAARTADVTLANGKKVSGVLGAQDSFTLHLKQRDGTLLMLDRKDIRGISNAAPLAGPAIAARLSATDIDNIAAFLLAQKARNLAETAKRAPAPVLPYPRIAAPDARDWASPRGTLDGSGFSALTQMTPANVGRLQGRWAAGLGEGAAASTPIAANGVLYVSGAAGSVTAIDARSGLALWQFRRQPPIAGAASASGNRGVAVLDGRVFVGTSDNKLIALDAHNGRVLWEKPAASTLDGYAMTGAPLALRTRVIVGVAGAGPEARGWLDAYDPATGAKLWRLETVATPQDAGALTASTGAYEAANVTLYWTTTRTMKDGANGDSVLAINANSGAITWRHALKPGAGGGNVAMVDLSDKGKRRALLVHVGRDGLLTVMDRADGKTVLEKALTEEAVTCAVFSLDRSSAVVYAGLGETVLATDARNGRVLWRTSLGSAAGGVLANRGGAVFISTAEGNFLALDGKSGKILWSFKTPAAISAAPISYAVDGKQYVAVTAGSMVYSFALPN